MWKNFKIIRMVVVARLKKSNFLRWKTLYPGTSYPGNTVLYSVNGTRHDVLMLVKINGFPSFWFPTSGLLTATDKWCRNNMYSRCSRKCKISAIFCSCMCISRRDVRFEVLTAMLFQIFWDVMLCHWVSISRHFNGSADEDTMILWHTGNYWPSDTTSHTRRLEFTRKNVRECEEQRHVYKNIQHVIMRW
jgi:hypothetical protein